MVEKRPKVHNFCNDSTVKISLDLKSTMTKCHRKQNATVFEIERPTMSSITQKLMGSQKEPMFGSYRKARMAVTK